MGSIITRYLSLSRLTVRKPTMSTQTLATGVWQQLSTLALEKEFGQKEEEEDEEEEEFD